MKTRPLAPSPLVFFLVTFAFSWLIWIPLAISHLSAAPFIPEGTSNGVRLLGVLGPAIIAILLSAIIGGRVASGGARKRHRRRPPGTQPVPRHGRRIQRLRR